MTSVLIQDFSERSKEVSKYFIFLRNLEQGATKLGLAEEPTSIARQLIPTTISC